ncbi:hypothetical protein HMPREF9440_00610 [Sutterella parvirubra YIT 11816]|uniref:Uncharacterized protein n=1 Tax=Sutterella parvirubra YIT 11816 TaxID=762967 RepID=H3KD05_9BURK|nr:hypothetical protein HMPREF9440_00610 [Sutterella parvirubra YIT 11816]
MWSGSGGSGARSFSGSRTWSQEPRLVLGASGARSAPGRTFHLHAQRFMPQDRQNPQKSAETRKVSAFAPSPPEETAPPSPPEHPA